MLWSKQYQTGCREWRGMTSRSGDPQYLSSPTWKPARPTLESCDKQPKGPDQNVPLFATTPVFSSGSAAAWRLVLFQYISSVLALGIISHVNFPALGYLRDGWVSSRTKPVAPVAFALLQEWRPSSGCLLLVIPVSPTCFLLSGSPRPPTLKGHSSPVPVTVAHLAPSRFIQSICQRWMTSFTYFAFFV